MRKSQISIEFMFALGIIFFIFLVIFGFMLNRSKELTDSNIEVNKRNTCLLISSLLTSAFVNGNGVVINASIEHKANVSDIRADVKGLNVEGSYCLLPIHTLPNAKLKKGVIKIENRNNYIEIENV